MSWLDDPLAKAAVSLAPERVLRTLAGVTREDSPPFVTVYLSGGHILDGELVTVGERGDDVVVLVDPQSGQLGYVLLSSVLVVRSRNPEPFRDLLSGGRVSLPEPVTRLALRREFTPTETFPVDVDWAAIDGSDRMVGNLAGLLRGLRDAVSEVCADDMGQQAWAQVHTLRVEHGTGSSLSVVPITGGLAVQANLSAALPRALQGELVRKISALL